MADYSKSKKSQTHIFPERVKEATGLLDRVEPMMTASTFKNRFLKGVPLKLKNGDVITDENITDYLTIAINEAEMNLQLNIDPVQKIDRVPFDRNLYKEFIHIKTSKRPIVSVEQLAIYSSRGENLFTIPLDWVDPGQFHVGQVNVIPYLSAYGGQAVTGIVSNAGIAFLTTLEGISWMPSYWNITYTHGLCSKAGRVPIIVNKYIGVLAVHNILSMIGPNDDVTSTSLGQDGISQSSSRAAIQRYQLRLRELEAERDKLEMKIRGLFRTRYYLSNI